MTFKDFPASDGDAASDFFLPDTLRPRVCDRGRKKECQTTLQLHVHSQQNTRPNQRSRRRFLQTQRLGLERCIRNTRRCSCVIDAAMRQGKLVDTTFMKPMRALTLRGHLDASCMYRAFSSSMSIWGRGNCCRFSTLSEPWSEPESYVSDNESPIEFQSPAFDQNAHAGRNNSTEDMF